MPDLNRRAFLQRTSALTAGWALAGPAADDDPQARAEAFLREFVAGWLPRETAFNEAAWAAATDVCEDNTQRQVQANLVRSHFVGDPQVIATVKELLAHRDRLNDLTARQLDKIRLMAAEAPGTIPEVVTARAEAEARQSATQDGFIYELDGNRYSANQIDRILLESRDLAERQRIWTLSKSIGGPLRDGLLRLRDLRNRVARELGFDDFFALQVADYGLTVTQMLDLCEGFVAAVRPLYQHLHTWAKHELAARFGVEPPAGPIPAHWLPNRWGQNWPGLVSSVDMDAPFRTRTKEFITQQAEAFYTSLGFEALPDSFWTRSDLYPVEPPSTRKKNSHASAWHIDLERDVRSLMSIEPNNYWFNTAHHELGHIYYFLAYSRDDVPHVLRTGANRAFHEGVGDLIGLAASQRPYWKQAGLLTPEIEAADPILLLLDTALDGASIVFIPFAAGTMTRFEHEFYTGQIPDDALNAAWWRLVRQYQGITPPEARPETLCDPATKTHINDDPAQYYDYAIGTILKFQLHDHICRAILHQDPRDCSYYGNPQVGRFLRSILALGATRDWNSVLREATGQGLSAEPLVAYFAPLKDWLEQQNAGRKIGWD
jgi:peptidyl-dipeptidase A